MNKDKNKIPSINKSKKATKGTKIAGGVILCLYAVLTITSLVASFMNFDATWATLTGKPVYTQEQAETYSKEQNKENTILLEKFKIDLDLAQIALSNEQIINQNNVELLKQKQTELTAKSTELATLQVTNAENLGKITAYETQINTLKEQLKAEQNKNDADEQKISSLNNQILTLETEKQNLENINASNNNTINNLNSQVLNLNNTVTELTNSINKNSVTIQQLNARVNELQESVKYYELLIGSYNFEDKAVITFELKNSVYALQVIEKGTAPTETRPEDTPYIKFNYWEDETGARVDFATFKPTTNVKLIANVTYSFDVYYYDGNNKYNSTIVEQGQAPANLQLTNTSEKRFKGWSFDGVNVIEDLTTVEVNETTNLYAVWEYAKEVKFVNGTEQVGTIRKAFNTSELTFPTPTKAGYRLLGWTLDGENLVDTTNYELTTNVVFMAKFELIEHTLTFVADDVTFNTFKYSVENNNINVTAPTKADYTFTYYSDENGKKVNLEELVVDRDMILKANYLYSKLIGEYKIDNFSVDASAMGSMMRYMYSGTISIKDDGSWNYSLTRILYKGIAPQGNPEIFNYSDMKKDYITYDLSTNLLYLKVFDETDKKIKVKLECTFDYTNNQITIYDYINYGENSEVLVNELRFTKDIYGVYSFNLDSYEIGYNVAGKFELSGETVTLKECVYTNTFNGAVTNDYRNSIEYNSNKTQVVLHSNGPQAEDFYFTFSYKDGWSISCGTGDSNILLKEFTKISG